MFNAANHGSAGRRERKERSGEEKGGVIRRVMTSGDTVSLRFHLLRVNWSTVHWGRGQELGLRGGKVLEIQRVKETGLLFQTHAKVKVGFPRNAWWFLRFWGNVPVLGRKAGNDCFNMNVKLPTSD